MHVRVFPFMFWAYVSRWVRVCVRNSLHVRGISSVCRLNPRVVEAVSVASATTQSLSFSNSFTPLGRRDIGAGREMRGCVKEDKELV